MKKEMTLEQKAIVKKKEAKEIAKWEKEKTKPKSTTRFALAYTLIILVLIYVIDEITTAIGTQMQAEIALHLFGGKLSVMTLLSAISLPILGVSLFYRTFSDRFGRRPFLIINTIGMGIGLFLVFLAGKIGAVGGSVMYVIATCVINFFTPNDIQAVYIMEVSDSKKRASTYAIIKAIATLGVVLIPLMRSVFMGNDSSEWYLVYIVPILCAVVVAIIAALTIRETDVFIDKRLEYLKKTDEERQSDKEKQNAEAYAQGGIGASIRFAFKHKQLKWLFISLIIYGLASMACTYYPAISSAFYSVEDVTKILFIYSFSNALMVLLNGLVGDKLGRKMVCIILCACSFVGFVLFYLGCRLAWNPYLVGLFIGLYVGGYYAAGDTIGAIMVGESSPTNLRASCISAAVIFKTIGSIVANLIPMLVLFITKDNYGILGIACAVSCAPAMVIVLFLLFAKVGETKGLELTEVKGDEWDK